ncbi:hypothetical protein HWV62_9563 [Athelia sp. TMB]|nr:hypothetical protein HWV62_9563 [Athelia sp. TMB]
MFSGSTPRARSPQPSIATQTEVTLTPAASTTHLNPGPSEPSAPPTLTDQTNLLPFKTIITVFLGLALCVVVSSLDSVVVATALPTISADLDAGSVISWVPSAYFLASTAFQPIYGRLSDIFGRKATLCFAMSVFVLGSLAAGFSRNIVELIIFRGVAGAGGGAILPVAQIIMSDIVSLQDRGKYQGIIGSVVAIANGIGPPLGGALAEKVGWKWCFWVTLPIALSSMIVVQFVLPLKPVVGDMRQKLMAVDYLGSLLTLAGCALIILPLIWGGVTFPWNSPAIISTLASGVAVICIFCLWEWRGAKIPIVPMYIFKKSTISGVCLCMFVNGFIFNSSLFFMPQFFQLRLGFLPTLAGTFLLPIPFGLSFANMLSGIVVSRTGRYLPLIYAGFSMWAIGCGCISAMQPSTPKPVIFLLMVMCGLGAGMTQQTTTIAAQASVSRMDMSVATTMRNFARLLGSTISVALSSTLINNYLTKSMQDLGLPSETISAVIEDPYLLKGPSPALDALGISAAEAAIILSRGYNRGFAVLFVVHASLAVFATCMSVAMIKHTSLSKGKESEVGTRRPGKAAREEA